MLGLEGLGRLLLILGGVMALIGLGLMLLGRVPFVGRLPGDIFIQRDGFTLYLPIVTMIIVSVILTIVLNVILRLFSR